MSEQKAAMGGNGGEEGYGQPVVGAVSDSRGPVSSDECRPSTWRVCGCNERTFWGNKSEVGLSLYAFE